VDEIIKVEGILNATTNFIMGEIEEGRNFQEALEEAIRAGWAETNYADGVDGIDAARRVVILANALFEADAKLEGVKVRGIRNVETMVKSAQKSNERVKLICEIVKGKSRLSMTVKPRQILFENQLATVNHGDMGIRFTFKTSQEIFVSAKFAGPMQTAYAVLSDMTRIGSTDACG
jgi:homoserine dehydrogenase